MADYMPKKASSNVAKTALGLSIGALGVNALTGGGLLPGLLRANAVQPAAVPAASVLSPAYVPAAPAYAPVPGCGYVSEKELCYIRELSEKDAVIARQGAEQHAQNYTNAVVAAAVAPIAAKLEEHDKEICSLKAGLGMESERRACGDEKILTYVDGNFIPADKRLNSCHIDYHGVRPVLETRHKHHCHDHHDACGCGE